MELPHLVAVYASVELDQNILEKSVNKLVKVATHFYVCSLITARTVAILETRNERTWK